MASRLRPDHRRGGRLNSDTFRPDYSAIKLEDPYCYSDPRQYYYNTYVSARADAYDAFGRTLKYVEDRQMFDRLPEDWHAVVVRCLLPLRHYEAGGQLISTRRVETWPSA